jgi:large subunit ribosomal protein L28
VAIAACRKSFSLILPLLRRVIMSAHCQVTGRTVGFGNSVSHSHRRSRRRWSPNIQTKTYFLPSEGRRVKLRLSAKGIKVVDRDGIEAVLARLRRDGQRI